MTWILISGWWSPTWIWAHNVASHISNFNLISSQAIMRPLFRHTGIRSTYVRIVVQIQIKGDCTCDFCLAMYVYSCYVFFSCYVFSCCVTHTFFLLLPIYIYIFLSCIFLVCISGLCFSAWYFPVMHFPVKYFLVLYDSVIYSPVMYGSCNVFPSYIFSCRGR